MHFATEIVRFLRRILPVFLLVASFSEAGATHIVGGELNYTYLGNDSVYVKVKVYRDSINADPYFDTPMRLYVYDSSDAFVSMYLVPLPDVKLVIPQIEDSCFVEPPNVLVDFVIYEDTLYIPGITTGWTMAYFRCCRNDQILNIESVDFLSGDTLPGEKTGAVYPAIIPDLTIWNSNPEFNTFPPVAICVDKQLNYDHSATDPDGDSLVYKLCTPYTGGNEDNVFGVPEIQVPPFQEVLFIPPYSLENVMGGVPLDIDPQTGLLTAVPNTLGRFVIAVCIDEYRDGDFLAQHRRDFQFNVVPCDKVYGADFFVSEAPKIDTLDPFNFLFCDTTLTKQFTADLSEPAPVLWDFGDGSISSELNPNHTFPSTGVYSVTLIAGPGEFCADTMVKVIQLEDHVTGADFTFQQDECATGSVPVQFNDASTGDVPIVEWQWQFGDGGNSSLQDPMHTYLMDETYDVSLLVIAESGCCALAEESITLYNTDTIWLPDTLVSCFGDSILLPLQAPEGSSFSWSPAPGLSNISIQQPLAHPATNTSYQVVVEIPTPSGDTCRRTERCVILVEDILPEISLDNIGEDCSADVLVNATTSFVQPVDWIWSQNMNFADTITDGPLLETIMNSNVETYYVQAAAPYCINTDAITLRREFVNVLLDSIRQCGPEEVFVNFEVITPSGYELTWMINDSVFNAQQPFDWTPEFGVTDVVVSGTNDEGCSFTDTSAISVFPVPVVEATGEPTEISPGDTAQLLTNDNPYFTYAWTPDEVLNASDIPDPFAILEVTTLFEVMISDTNGCVASDTVLIIVQEFPCSDEGIFVPNAFSPNGDGLNDVFRPRGDIIESMILVVYDRWGNKIFEGTDVDAGWDGTYNGQLLSGDSFGYLLYIVCEGQQTYRKQGNVTLMR